jgi:tetratricopeptide (TPR) repeat protein
MISTKLGRNESCPCGSGKKFKNCCARTEDGSQKQAVNDRNILQVLKASWLYFDAGQIDRSTLLCHQILQVLPQQPDAHHLLGTIALKDGDINLAINHLCKAISLKKNDPALYGNLGLAYHEAGELKKAESFYRRALDLNPRYLNAYYNLHALLLRKDLSQAIQCMENLLALGPNDLDSRIQLGILLEYIQRPELARKHLEHIESAPAVIKARLEAWRYLQASTHSKLPLLGSTIETFQLAFQSATNNGLVLEFGVRHGNSLRQIAKLAAQHVHGFDSFQGLPEVWHHEPKGSYTTKGVIPSMPNNVSLHVGWFHDTLPNFLEENSGPIRLVNIDCDIYSSTKTVLELLAPRIVPGSIVIFDEYIGNEHWKEDEFKAFQEAVKYYGWSYEYLSFSLFTKQVALRIT